MKNTEVDVVNKGLKKKDPNQMLYDFQLEAIENMYNGSILNGGTGSGIEDREEGSTYARRIRTWWDGWSDTS